MPTEAITASVAEVAKDFAKDPTSARRKYGANVRVHGTVAFANPDSLQMTSTEGWTVIFRGRITGTGPKATVNARSMALGSRLVVFYGDIERSGKKEKGD